MKKSVDIIGLSIISISEGKELGTAKDMVIDALKGEVAAIVVEDGKWYLGAKLLPFKQIQGIGEYALTIENSSAVVPLTSMNEVEKLLENDVRVKGTKVLTKGGKMHGQVTEILIDEQSGQITGCEVKLVNGDITIIPAEQVITFGKDVLVIAEDLTQPVLERVAVSGTVAAVETPAPTPVVAPAAPSTPVVETPVVAQPDVAATVDAAKEDLSKKFDEKHRKFVLGKKTTRRIEADNGEVIVEQGAEITDEVIQKAKSANKFIELTMSIAP